MKIKITSNFSFEKLINFLKKGKGLGTTIDRYITKPLVEDSKSKIRNNKVTPRTSPSTLKKRMARATPKAISSSTLYDTGKLHDSIRLSDKRGTQTSILLKNARRIEMLEYGKYHQLGMPPNKQRKFLELSSKSERKASRAIISRMVRSWKKKIAK